MNSPRVSLYRIQRVDFWLEDGLEEGDDQFLALGDGVKRARGHRGDTLGLMLFSCPCFCFLFYPLLFLGAFSFYFLLFGPFMLFLGQLLFYLLFLLFLFLF